MVRPKVWCTASGGRFKEHAFELNDQKGLFGNFAAIVGQYAVESLNITRINQE